MAKLNWENRNKVENVSEQINRDKARKEDTLAEKLAWGADIGEVVSFDEVIQAINGGVEKLLETKAEVTEFAKLERFRRIVQGISRKYASKWCDRDDIEQDLWVKVLELIAAAGDDETKLTDGFVARCCYNTAVDFYRYNRRRYDSKAELYDEFGNETSPGYKLSKAFIRNAHDEVVIKEVIDLFPKNSRPRKYVLTKLYIEGMIDETSGVDDELVLPSRDDEAAILQEILGYNSHYPGSWGRMKWGIREAIVAYLRK